MHSEFDQSPGNLENQDELVVDVVVVVLTAICEPGKQRSNVRLMPLDSVFECSFQHHVSQITVALLSVLYQTRPP
jgi:hypothetical protein